MRTALLRRRTARILICIVFCVALLSPQASAQSPNLTAPRLTLPQINNTDVSTAPIRLDGRKLFTIAVPATTQSAQSNQTSAIQLRAQGIEANLNRLATRSNTSELDVKAAIDANSNLPVITVNQQYLMTVTTLDAQLQGQEPQPYAEDLTRTIRDALVEARRERQPDYLTHQAWTAIAIIFGMLVISWIVARLQTRVRSQQKRLRSQTPQLSDVPPNTSDTRRNTQLIVQQQLASRQKRTIKDVQRRLLQMIQLAIWASGIFVILGLFPFTRSLQPIVLSTPLKVLGIIVAGYILIRLSELIVDRVFNAFDVADSTTDVSQRVALRVTTFSSVVKGVTTIVWISISAITILSIIGIQVLPLLAGAGIIGLGISLASQNLIKDVINGFLILLEDQYAVGDVIQVGAVSGFVETISLRITQIRNAEGRLITIPNSAIAIVENLSKDWSRVDLSITVSYEANVDQAIAVIQHVGEAMDQDPEWESKILEPPQVLGVEALNNAGVTLRIWIKTQPLQQWFVGREFRRRLKQALDAEGIEIGIPQQSFSVRGAVEEEIITPHNGKARS